MLGDGTTEAREYVFCEDVLRSVATSRCQTCPFAGAPARDTASGRIVDCRRSIPPIANSAVSSFPPAAAAVLPVGLVLARPVVCVDGSLPWEAVARTPVLLGSPGGVPVLDREGKLVLFLPRTTLALAGRSRLAGGPVSVADLAVTALAVHESASLRDAFAVMGRHRVREVTVVGDGGLVVGRLLDVDALHFVAHFARTGTRPAPDTATWRSGRGVAGS